MVAAHAILLALQGLPAVYIHSFLGSHGDKNAVKDSGIFRRINRAKLDFVRLSEQLIDPETERYAIYTRISDMAKARREEVLFSPKVAQRVLSWSKKLMVIERYTEQRRVLCLTNISNEMVSLPKPIEGFDLLSKQNLLLTAVTPYQIVWLV
jgi:sucrose phosphorylase